MPSLNPAIDWSRPTAVHTHHRSVSHPHPLHSQSLILFPSLLPHMFPSSSPVSSCSLPHVTDPGPQFPYPLPFPSGSSTPPWSSSHVPGPFLTLLTLFPSLLIPLLCPGPVSDTWSFSSYAPFVPIPFGSPALSWSWPYVLGPISYSSHPAPISFVPGTVPNLSSPGSFPDTSILVPIPRFPHSIPTLFVPGPLDLFPPLFSSSCGPFPDPHIYPFCFCSPSV